MGSRTSFAADAGARFDVDILDQGEYAVGSPLRIVPAPGYDAPDCMPPYQDRIRQADGTSAMTWTETERGHCLPLWIAGADHERGLPWPVAANQ